MGLDDGLVSGCLRWEGSRQELRQERPIRVTLLPRYFVCFHFFPELRHHPLQELLAAKNALAPEILRKRFLLLTCRFESPLEDMPGRSVLQWKRWVETPFSWRMSADRFPSVSFDQEMVMGGHQAAGVAEPIEIGDHPAENIQKHGSVSIIEVYQTSGAPLAITWWTAPGYWIRRGLAMSWP